MSKPSNLAWAILDTRWGEQMLFYGTCATRNEAIAELVWNYFGEPAVESKYPVGRKLRPRQKAEWQKLYRSGYRCVRVRVSVL